MKTMLLICISVILSLRSNENNNPQDFTSLKGKWVETDTKTDTLSFELSGASEWMVLSRGKEMRNGFLLPKSGSGPYNFKIKLGEISLLWSASSDANFHDFYFGQTADTIVIGNFYDQNLVKKIFMFQKLR